MPTMLPMNCSALLYGTKNATVMRMRKITVEFLKRNIEGLATDPLKGRLISQRSEWRYLTIRRASRGHGHIAVYSVNEGEIRILHIFHTAEDWPSKLPPS